MFAKNVGTKALNKTSKFEKGYSVGWHYNLPNKRVLFFAKVERRRDFFLVKSKKTNQTTLKIFSIDDLNKSIVEKTLDGKWRLLCLFPDGSLLLQGPALIKLCPDSLNIISSQS